MRVDIQSLGTFNQLAHEGSQAATRALADLTGIEAVVDVTRITLLSRDDVGEELAGGEFVGVQFDFDGAMHGEAVLVFEADSVERLGETLLSGDADEVMARSGVEEVANIMMSGFIDGWADHLEATIDHSPPEYIDGAGGDVLPPAPAGSDHQHVFVFTSRIERVGEAMDFFIYMLPDYGPFTELMADVSDQEGDAIPIDKLAVFDQMTTEGAETAAGNVEAMTGIATEAEVTRISFAAVEDVPRQIGTETYVGTVVEFTGVPSGYLLVLFDETSAVNVAEALLSSEPDGEGVTDAHRTAIEELGNILTSGFVDGWANVLQTSVEHSPPRLVHDMGQAIVDPLAAQVGQDRDHAFTIDSTMRTEEVAFEAEIHVLPDEAQFREALADLDVDRADQTGADADEIFEE